MKERDERFFIFGLLAAVGLFFAASEIPKQLERTGDDRRTQRAQAAEKLTVARRGRGRTSTPENQCLHCAGSGECKECAPEPCRVCRGRGIQPNNPVVVDLLSKIWNASR